MKRVVRRTPWPGIGLVALLWICVASAQTPPPLTIGNVPVGLGGSVSAIVRMPDGGLVIGGNFTIVDGVPRNNIARLNPDGTLDASWNANADGAVAALAAGADGSLFVGGYFTHIGGQPRDLLAKLAAGGHGAADAAWNARVRIDDDSGFYCIKAIAVDAQGFVYTGGYFHNVGGSARDFFVRLSGRGAGDLDTTWNPSVDSAVQALAIDADGMVYAGTQTDVYQAGIARFPRTGNGARDPQWTPSMNGPPLALAVDADGNVYAAGYFQRPLSQVGTGLLRFPHDAHGNVDADWNPPYRSAAALAIDASGVVYAAGPAGVARLSGATGVAAGDWAAQTGSASAIVLDASGSLYVGGDPNLTAGMGLARLSASTGAVEPAADVEVPGEVEVFARQANGGTIVGGYFTRAGTARRTNLFRIDADGTLDPDWNPSAPNRIVALAVDAHDDVYAGGYPTDVNGTLLKLAGSGSGAVDPDWAPPLTGEVYCLAIDEDGALYVGGWFGAIGGAQRRNIAKFQSESDVPDETWQPVLDQPVFALALDGDSVYAGGNFQTANGQPHQSLVKLSRATGAVENAWASPLSGLVRSLARADDGSLYAGGFLGTQDRRYLVKLAPDGTQDPLWNADPDDEIYALALGSDGAVYAAGTFRSIGRQQRTGLAKLSPSTGDADPAWDTTTDGDVAALLADADALYVGGYFSMLGGEPRGSIGALPAVKPENGSLLRGHSRHALPVRFSPAIR